MISNNLKSFYARGLHQLIVPGAFSAAAAPANLYTNMTPVRSFAKKTRKSKADEPTEEEEPVAEARHVEPEPVKAASKAVDAAELNLAKDLFQPFTLGNIKKIDSAPDHKAPSKEDTIEGRYAGVLFVAASQKAALYDVFEDMIYLRELYSNCENFRMFTENQGVGAKEIKLLNNALLETAPFSDLTMHFLTVLAENKRLVFIKEIAEKYEKLYAQFNKEEKITIISADELNNGQRDQVLLALQQNPQNEGKEFTIEYKVDANILGGLQMYTESEFMDMSLHSRVERINQEVAKLSQ